MKEKVKKETRTHIHAHKFTVCCHSVIEGALYSSNVTSFTTCPKSAASSLILLLYVNALHWWLWLCHQCSTHINSVSYRNFNHFWHIHSIPFMVECQRMMGLNMLAFIHLWIWLLIAMMPSISCEYFNFIKNNNKIRNGIERKRWNKINKTEHTSNGGRKRDLPEESEKEIDLEMAGIS